MTNNFHYKNSQFNLKPDSSNESYLVFDIETNGLYDKATELFCVAIHDVVRNETIGYGPGSIDRAINRLASATCLIGHNIIFYDLPVLKKLLNFEPKAHVIDTLSSEGQPHLRLGATDLVISKTISQTFLRTHKKCLSTANKIAMSHPLYTTSSPLIQSKPRLFAWNMISLKQLINKLDQVFLLTLVNVLILWMNLKLERK